MQPNLSHSAMPTTYELRFESLFQRGCTLVFPCDLTGLVSLDQLSERSRNNYLFARAVVGRDFAHPIVVPVCATA